MNCNYLAFEGIDGSGKTSFIEGLCEILENQSEELTNFFETLEENDDVQNIYSNAKFI